MGFRLPPCVIALGFVIGCAGGNASSGGAGDSGGSGRAGSTAGVAASRAGTSAMQAGAGAGANTVGGGSGLTGGAAATAGASGGASVGKVTDVAWVTGTCSKGTPDTIQFETAEFCVSLSKNSQTIAALQPKAAPGFDFTPADRLSKRAGAGYFQLGDLTLRLRASSSADWQNVTTSASRVAVIAKPSSDTVLAAADLAPALPANLPLTITRSWLLQGGRLILRFVLENKSSAPVQVGALGVPMIFDNLIMDRTLDQAHATCSFADPYVGRDAGYLQVTRLNGQGPALLVLPDGRTSFEAYNPIFDPPKPGSKDPVAVFTDLTPRGQTFEGFWEWMVHSKAYADAEWNHAQPWNPATELTLAAGESKTYGLVFVLSDRIRNIEQRLIENQRPVAVGIPGYILPVDIEGRLFLNYPSAVRKLDIEPAGALALTAQTTTPSGWKAYAVQAHGWGRARLTLTYEDGAVQTIHYYVTKAANQVVSDLGNFLTTKAWFEDANDPFGRSPAVMTFDHESNQIVTQAKQAWVAGLGDDGGATWLAGAMKLLGQPDADQVGKYQRFVDGAIWGGLQYKDGPQQYGVKRTLFYYEPSMLPNGYYSSSVQWIDPTTGQKYWGAWDRAHTLEVPRSYNYPHVAALYWSLYRLARNNPGLVSNHPWDWYLTQAYKTAITMTTLGNEYAKFGLMDGTVFLEILHDLQREGLSQNASDLEAKMKARETVWRTQNYPFGSEMPWDSTGQEEVYAWTRYFGDAAKAKTCIDAITGYMPALPHWGYNGCARRYWDFKYGGAKIDRLERMLHHYGSSLNAIPVLSEFRDHPDDFYLLRIGYAGMMGSLTNIDQDGFPSMAFHAFPDTLKWDAVSGDYGLNFFGHAQNTAAYLVLHAEFGWLAFGGNVSVSDAAVRMTVLDSFRQRVYLAQLGLWLTLDSGQFRSVEFDLASHAVRVELAPADAHTPSARLRVEQPAKLQGVDVYTPSAQFVQERAAYVVPLGSGVTQLELTVHGP
jgi:hypothetical protein